LSTLKIRAAAIQKLKADELIFSRGLTYKKLTIGFIMFWLMFLFLVFKLWLLPSLAIGISGIIFIFLAS